MKKFSFKQKEILESNGGFTLVELLAVVVIIAILMSISIPAVQTVVLNSRKDVYLQNVNSYKKQLTQKINNGDYIFNDPDTTYYVHIDNLDLNMSSKEINPLGKFIDAYVVCTYDVKKKKWTYYWVALDSAGNYVNLAKINGISRKDIKTTSKKTVNNRQPVGTRNFIVIVDKYGVVHKPVRQLRDVTKEEADVCYSYKLKSDKTASITYYKHENKSCGKEVVIPGMIDGYLVTEIYQYSFNNMGLTSVVIPDGVKTIGTRAFAYNPLKCILVNDVKHKIYKIT